MLNERVLSPSQLNRESNQMLQQMFGMVWLEGEISNFTRASSGHWYFSLKDEQAQVKCAMFKGRNRLTALKPENGLLIRIRAKVGLYEPRGDFQLVAEQAEEAGLGQLHIKYQQLKNQLKQEGLFEATSKKTIPRFPATIGLITSKKGAAIQDVLHTLHRRYPLAEIEVFDTRVQGSQAVEEICAVLKQAGQKQTLSTLILTRGGGSLEDLWCFNEEAVVRAVAECPLPIIAAIGHETDITLSELAADLRAATPTAAAELATPDQGALKKQLGERLGRLNQALNLQLENQAYGLDHLEKRLKNSHPSQQIQNIHQKIILRQSYLNQFWAAFSHQMHKQLDRHTQTLKACSPANAIEKHRMVIKSKAEIIQSNSEQALENKKQLLRNKLSQINILNPLQTLERGYTVSHDKQGQLIHSYGQLKAGDLMMTRTQDGEISSRVESSKPTQQLANTSDHSSK